MGGFMALKSLHYIVLDFTYVTRYGEAWDLGRLEAFLGWICVNWTSCIDGSYQFLKSSM